MREFQHRVANTLAILSSSLRMELANFDAPGLSDALRRHEAQIVAVADLHRFFSHCFGNVEIPADHYFQPLCAVLSRSILAPLGLQCEVSVDKAPMCAEECELLGLAVSELVLNAAKHAFSERISGSVRIEIFEQESLWFCIVSDNGTGMRGRCMGSGSLIMDSLVSALGGQLVRKTGPEGTAIAITFIGNDGLQPGG